MNMLQFSYGKASVSLGQATWADSAYEERVRPALDLIDQLRHIGVEREIEIPQIAGEIPLDISGAGIRMQTTEQASVINVCFWVLVQNCT